jgi:hypothetical protein
MQNNINNISEKYDASFNNLISRLLNEIRDKFEKEFNIDGLFERIKTAGKGEMAKLWEIFKNENLILIYCSTFITRLLILLSQTQLLVLEKLNSRYKFPKDLLDELLTDLWIMTKDYLDYLIKHIRNKLERIVNEISLRQSFRKEEFLEEIFNLRNEIEVIVPSEDKKEAHFEILGKYFKGIETKINELENNTFTNNMKGYKISAFIKFYQINYDIVSSNLFQIILLKALDHDFNLVKEAIYLNFECHKKSKNDDSVNVAHIANFVNKISKRLLDQEETIFLNNKLKDEVFFQDLSEYFNIIYE